MARKSGPSVLMTAELIAQRIRSARPARRVPSTALAVAREDGESPGGAGMGGGLILSRGSPRRMVSYGLAIHVDQGPHRPHAHPRPLHPALAPVSRGPLVPDAALAPAPPVALLVPRNDQLHLRPPAVKRRHARRFRRGRRGASAGRDPAVPGGDRGR